LSEMIGQMGLFQLILDGALLLCLFFLIFWMRRTPGRVRGRKILESAEEFMAASEKMNSEFEKNLNRKRTLIGELMSGLDQRSQELTRLLDQAEVILSRLEKAGDAPPDRLDPEPHLTTPASKSSALSQSEQDVLSLYRRGLPVARIASQLRLPKGEVELILGLHRRS